MEWEDEDGGGGTGSRGADPVSLARDDGSWGIMTW